MLTPASPWRAAARRGVTLIELMVGVGLGMVVTAALLLLFADVSRNAQQVARVSAQIEGGRYTAELLRDDLQLAGFYGETSYDGAVFTTPDPCSTDASAAGFAGAPFGLPTPVRGYSAVEALACLTSRFRLAGTDALAVRRLAIETVDPTALPVGNTQYHVQYSFCSSVLAPVSLVFAKSAADFSLLNRACAGANLARAYVSRIYFVASCNRCGVAGDAVPTLKRLDLVGNQLVETALVEGIESFRLEYGFDTDGNGSADTYLTAATATGPTSLWENVVALKLHYIVRSVNATPNSPTATAQAFDLGGAGTVNRAADGFNRRAYSTTIRLINTSGAREAQ